MATSSDESHALKPAGLRPLSDARHEVGHIGAADRGELPLAPGPTDIAIEVAPVDLGCAGRKTRDVTTVEESNESPASARIAAALARASERGTVGKVPNLMRRCWLPLVR